MKVAIIPARGGSKRIPRKNVKLFCGKPIIAYSIEAAVRSGVFDDVIVSTDDAEIADVAKQERVGLFSRFALMRKSIDAGVSQAALVSWDGLHNTADGYDCIGRALARAISKSAR